MNTREELDQLIAALRESLQEITGVTVVTHEGEAVSSDFPATESARVAAVSAAAAGLGNSISGYAKLGGAEEIILRGNDHLLMIYLTSSKNALAVRVPANSNLGLVRLEAGKAALTAAKILDAAETPDASSNIEEDNQLKLLTSEILQQIPDSVRFGDAHAKCLQQHKALLQQWEPGLIQGFYDTLFSYPATAAILSNDERSEREKTLRNWYQRTINGPFNQDYWEWQAFVGLVHIRSKVNNAMVSGMWGWIMTYLSQQALEALDTAQAAELIAAIHALQSTVMALIAESYQRNMFTAVNQSAGLNDALLHRLVELEIGDMLAKAR